MTRFSLKNPLATVVSPQRRQQKPSASAMAQDKTVRIEPIVRPQRRPQQRSRRAAVSNVSSRAFRVKNREQMRYRPGASGNISYQPFRQGVVGVAQRGQRPVSRSAGYARGRGNTGRIVFLLSVFLIAMLFGSHILRSSNVSNSWLGQKAGYVAQIISSSVTTEYRSVSEKKHARKTKGRMHQRELR